MRIMADLLRRGRPAEEVMAVLAGEERQLAEALRRRWAQRPVPVRQRPEVQEVSRDLSTAEEWGISAFAG